MSDAAACHDVVVIGAGPGGYVAALRAAQLGARVALVERAEIGGTCLNRGCIPTKAMVHDAELYAAVASGAYCVAFDGQPQVDYARLLARRQQVVGTLVEGVERLLSSARVEVIAGQARLSAPGRVTVTGAGGDRRELRYRGLVLATGSTPARLDLPGSDLPGVVDSDGLLALDRLPQSLVVVGASTIGVEFACIYHALGTRVSVLGRRTFLRDAEQQLARRMRALLSQRGIEVAVGLEFRRIEPGGDGCLRVVYERRGREEYAEGEVVLIATGRTPVTEGLGLEEVGVRLERGAVAVDAHMETSVPGIYAIGDCIGGHMLAHVASYEGEVAVENIMGHPREADYRVVPNCIFTLPEIAGVGLTEAQAKEQGLQYKVSRFPLNANGRALAMGEPEGQVRIICEGEREGPGRRVLGVHIMGTRASDLVAEAALALRLGATARDMAETIHAHPTVPEALMEAAKGQLDGAIHYDHR